jgi:hypothetical protein
MRLPISTDELQFIVATPPKPVPVFGGAQGQVRVDRDGRPIYAFNVLATTGVDADVLSVKVAGEIEAVVGESVRLRADRRVLGDGRPLRRVVSSRGRRPRQAGGAEVRGRRVAVMSTATDERLIAGATGSGKGSVLWSIDSAQRQILVRVDRAVRVGERELRYQLERKDNHPLAREDELLDVLANLGALGLVEAELCFRLTPEGRARLAQDGGDRR